MAIRDVRVLGGNGINYTKECDSSGDHASIANSTYFRDLSDGLIKFKNSYGNVMEAFKTPPPNVQTVTSAATITATSTDDLVNVTALAVGTTIANPTGTFVNGQIVSYRIKDNATPRTIAYGTKFKAFGSALPTTTVASKITLLSAMYNSVADTFETVNSQEQ